jgi:hypothetical protein
MNLKVGFAHNSQNDDEEEQDSNEDADALNLTVGSDTDDGKFIAYSAFLSKNEMGSLPPPSLSPITPTGPPISSPVGGDSCTVCGDRASGKKRELR